MIPIIAVAAVAMIVLRSMMFMVFSLFAERGRDKAGILAEVLYACCDMLLAIHDVEPRGVGRARPLDLLVRGWFLQTEGIIRPVIVSLRYPGAGPPLYNGLAHT